MTGIDMERDDIKLDEFFAAARRAEPVPSESLMARILADAEAEMPNARSEAVLGGRQNPMPDRAAPARGLLAGLLGAVGGWGGIGGLATAMAAGLWFGYLGIADPGSLTGGLVGSTSTSTTVELLPGTEALTLAAGWEG